MDLRTCCGYMHRSVIPEKLPQERVKPAWILDFGKMANTFAFHVFGMWCDVQQ